MTAGKIKKQVEISIHALLAEGDVHYRVTGTGHLVNFYPRPPRGGRRATAAFCPGFICISIHALLAEGDKALTQETITFIISIHALLAEGDDSRQMQVNRDNVFLSTPSSRRATCRRSSAVVPATYFYPRPPRGGRRCFVILKSRDRLISIHALLAEGDRSRSSTSIRGMKFLSTPSSRRATSFPCIVNVTRVISIHALLAEGDGRIRENSLHPVVFLSTPSSRRATAWPRPCEVYSTNFYPRPPRGGRRAVAMRQT